ncbi:unnamed protein product [Paramecium octaurelia]|uniref:IC97/Casc1 N-terminal domain-containing protein n=1 Tax=Paramecium octaurelia TaxID=43137 RepID=A0A8S1WEH7_PAROT|nr:unnamed protein product [Paramecium octaurelia]
MNIQNYSSKDDKKKTLLKPRIRSSSKEATQQLTQPRIAIQNPPVYRNTTADKHRKHSVDNKKQVKQKKKKKTQKNLQQLDNQEEQRLLEEEQKRIRDLEEFQRQQWEKMSQEERDRLKNEENDRVQIEMNWDKEIHEYKKKCLEMEEWNNYISCNTQIDPRSEKDLNTVIYQLSTNNDDISLNYKQIEYISTIIFLIQVAHQQDLSQSIFNKQDHYFRYIEKLKSIQSTKIYEIIKHFYIHYENYLDELNHILKHQYFLLEFNQETQQRILQKIAQKPEDRVKYEILKYTEFSNSFKAAFWYCPLSKIGYRIKPIDFSQISNLQIEIPRQLAGQSLIYYVTWTNHDPYVQYKQYTQYLPIGGIFQNCCVNLPKLSKKTNGWILKPTFTDSQLQPLKLAQGFQSYSCFFQISNQYYLQDASKLFVVTFQNGNWTQEGIEDLKVNIDTRSVSFSLKNQLPFMLATLKFADFPFKTWKISSLSPNKVYINIITQRDINIGIELDSKLSKLVKPASLAQQNFKEPLPIIELLLKLRNFGINLIAQEEDAICLQTVFKRSEVENQVLLNLMQTLRVYSFKQSKWNQKCGSDQIIIQFIENPNFNQDFEGDDEFQWRNLEFQLNKVSLLEGNDKSDKFSSKWSKNTVSHANLLILIQQHQITPPELQFYIEEIQNVELRSNLRTMLKVMRLLAIN